MIDVVRTMRDENISSVLVLNKERLVSGIVTERDIVQKFTLIEGQSKMSAKVAAFMTRPVQCARLSHLDEDVRELFFQKRLRHFPVTVDSLHENDILGMLTVTDMSGAYLRSSKLRMQEKDKKQNEPLVVIAREEKSRTHYKALFEALRYLPIAGLDKSKLIKQAVDYAYPLVFDIHGIPFDEIKQDIVRLKEHKGVFIILSSQASLVEPLRKVLNQDQQFVALKPLDISYLLSLLASIQKAESKDKTRSEAS